MLGALVLSAKGRGPQITTKDSNTFSLDWDCRTTNVREHILLECVSESQMVVQLNDYGVPQITDEELRKICGSIGNNKASGLDGPPRDCQEPVPKVCGM